jgi:hypothetical protein
MVSQLLFISRLQGFKGHNISPQKGREESTQPFQDHSRLKVRRQKYYHEGLGEEDHLRRK